ncbi:MAG: polyprenyl synthetase family protein [Candidatus Hydrogenedentota bacterium]
MASLDLAEYLGHHRASVDDAVASRLPAADREPRLVHEAMRYVTLSGGKRLRPIVSLAVAQLAGRAPAHLLDAACAVELVHTSSLILDDLPCMDDAQERRGQPCIHVKYGRATALLAAMALLSRAFELVAANAAAVRPESAAEVVSMLSKAVGSEGLVHGQHLDLQHTDAEPTLDGLIHIHALKAGALFLAAVQIPACLAGLSGRETSALAEYARGVGLAFQIIDDLHDAASSREDAGKGTYAQLLGERGARDRANALLSQAVQALAPFGEAGEPLRLLAEHLRANMAV